MSIAYPFALDAAYKEIDRLRADNERLRDKLAEALKMDRAEFDEVEAAPGGATDGD